MALLGGASWEVDGLASRRAVDQPGAVTRLIIPFALTRAVVTGTADIMQSADGLMGGIMRLHLRGVDVMNHPVTKGAVALVGAIITVIGVGAGVSEIASGPFAEMLGLPSTDGNAP